MLYKLTGKLHSDQSMHCPSWDFHEEKMPTIFSSFLYRTTFKFRKRTFKWRTENRNESPFEMDYERILTEWESNRRPLRYTKCSYASNYTRSQQPYPNLFIQRINSMTCFLSSCLHPTFYAVCPSSCRTRSQINFLSERLAEWHVDWMMLMRVDTTSIHFCMISIETHS